VRGLYTFHISSSVLIRGHAPMSVASFVGQDGILPPLDNRPQFDKLPHTDVDRQQYVHCAFRFSLATYMFVKNVGSTD
jgi:hypothetical protein